MQTRLPIWLSLIIVLATPSVSHADAPLPLPAPSCVSATECDRDPEHLTAFIASFYKWYTTFWYEPVDASGDQSPDQLRPKSDHTSLAVKSHNWNNSADQPTIKQAVTTRFFKDFYNIASNEYDGADPLTRGQDLVDVWADNITIKTILVGDKKAQFEVHLGVPEKYASRLLVTLRPSRGKWLIDDVKDLSPWPTGDK